MRNGSLAKCANLMSSVMINKIHKFRKKIWVAQGLEFCTHENIYKIKRYSVLTPIDNALAKIQRFLIWIAK